MHQDIYEYVADALFGYWCDHDQWQSVYIGEFLGAVKSACPADAYMCIENLLYQLLCDVEKHVFYSVLELLVDKNEGGGITSPLKTAIGGGITPDFFLLI